MRTLREGTLPPLEHCVARIDTEYRRLGHEIGWRFLTGPTSTWTPTANIAFITLNPGGNRDDRVYPREGSGRGSVYWVESWEGRPAGLSPLQVQVQALFGEIATVLGHDHGTAHEFICSRVLGAYFVPFRSRSLGELHRPEESLKFARDLWSDILADWSPDTILTTDTTVFANLKRMTNRKQAAAHTLRLPSYVRFETGWGNVTAEAVRYKRVGANGTVTLARIPNLSRFKLFSRAACFLHVRRFLKYVFAPA